MKKKGKFSVNSRNLNNKLKIGFALMSVLPLLVSIYLISSYILPKAGLKLDITVFIGISIFIAISGFILVKQIFDRIISMSDEAKLIAAGDLSHIVEITERDEVGDLGGALNQLTGRIRSNMDELKNYSERTTEINIEIQKRVLVLSSLLQISSLISQATKLDDILKIITEKSRLLASSDKSFLLFRTEKEETFSIKIVDGVDSSYLLKAKVAPQEMLFDKFVKPNKPFVVDKQNLLPDNIAETFYEKFKLKSVLALPIYLRGRVIGALCIGSSRDKPSYSKDDIELMDVFGKQVAIAVENDLLTHKIERLEIKDTLTGLYNEGFINSRLQEEIKRAISFHRPCSYILFNIDNFQKYYQNFGSLHAESALKRIATLIKDSISEIDRLGRVGDNEFAIILPEKNKRKAQEAAEDIRKKIEFSFGEESDINKRITISAGVSENPLDGIEAGELVLKAKELLKLAKNQGKNRVSAF